MQSKNPIIRILQPGDEEALEAFLVPRIESSMFLIGNLRASGLVDRGEPYEGTYAAALEQDEIAGVVAHTWNGNLIVQAPDHVDLLWPAAVEASGRPVSGVIGPEEQVTAVMAGLRVDARLIQMDRTEKLYSLSLNDLAVPDDLRSGVVCGRRIELRDVEILTHWRVAYSIEALGAEDGPRLREQCRAGIERSLAEGTTWVTEQQGEAVSASGFNTAIAEAVQIGGVWTPPELRRQGYARAAVAASLLDARAEGVETAILFTGWHNVAAQKAYEALGFRHIGSYRLVLLKSPVQA